jgi:2-keto-3-deoxy-L-rhamnonate aldolase RhmA
VPVRCARYLGLSHVDYMRSYRSASRTRFPAEHDACAMAALSTCSDGMTDSYAVEMIAALGFDWLLIDMEHIPMSKERLKGILIACKGESVPIVRVASA